MALEKSALINREGFASHEPIEQASSVWFGKTFLLNYLAGKGVARRY